MYEEFVSNESFLMQLTTKWSADLGVDIEYKDIQGNFKAIYVTTNVPKLRSFQFRLLHRAITTKIMLHKWGLQTDENCYYCSQYKETIIHLFVECEVVKQIWEAVQNYVHKRFNISFKIEADAILFNKVHANRGNVANLICLLVKQYIYRQKCLDKGLNPQALIKYLFQVECTEKYIAQKNNLIIKHNKKWMVGNPQTVNE